MSPLSSGPRHETKRLVPHQAGHSGKTVPELEKTIGLMKKVVERVQRENEALKKSSTPAHQDKVAGLEQENRRLKVSHLTCVKVPHLLQRCSGG